MLTSCSCSIFCIYCSFFYLRICVHIKHVAPHILYIYILLLLKKKSLSIAYGFQRNLRTEKHPANWNMLYIWTRNNLLIYINMNTIGININTFSLNFPCFLPLYYPFVVLYLVSFLWSRPLGFVDWQLLIFIYIFTPWARPTAVPLNT